MKKISHKEERNEEYNDFRNEWHILQVLGGYKLLKTSKLITSLNILYNIILNCVHAFTGTMAIMTLLQSNLEKTDMVHTLETILLVVYNMIIPSLALYYSDDLDLAMKSIREGVYIYSDGLEGDQPKIKKKCIGYIKTFNTKFTKLLVISIFSYLLGVPLLQYVNGRSGKDSAVNPLLPIPLLMPFDTFTVAGFAGAYLINAAQVIYLHIKGLCFGKLILSSLSQLSLQIEILNHSLANIKERTLIMLSNENCKVQLNIQQIYCSREFQDCIYKCLRENILHHHAILRLKMTLNSFISAGIFCSTLLVSLVMGSLVIVIIQDPVNNVAMAFLLSCVIFGFFSICWVGEIVNSQSAKTMDSIYSTPWYSCDRRYTVLINMMITNARDPVVFRTRGLNSSLSYEFFSDMVSFAYKIATLLR